HTRSKRDWSSDVCSSDLKETMPPLKGIIGDFAQSMSKDNITMEAVQTYFQKRTGRRAQKITSFSSEFKYSSATFEDGSYVFGAQIGRASCRERVSGRGAD